MRFRGRERIGQEQETVGIALPLRHRQARILDVGEAEFLAVLEQNPGTNWQALIGQIELATEMNPDLEPLPEEAAALAPVTALRSGRDGDDELSTFRL